MRLLICGSRTWTNKELIRLTLIKELGLILASGGDVVIIHGCAKGADTLADEIARETGIKVDCYYADWIKFGKSAGPLRNMQMLKEGKPDRALAFTNDIEHSKGTKNMVKLLQDARIPYRVISEPQENRYED